MSGTIDMFGETEQLSKESTLTIRISPNILDAFTEATKSKGLSKSQAIRMFIHQYNKTPRTNFLVKSIMKEEDDVK